MDPEVSWAPDGLPDQNLRMIGVGCMKWFPFFFRCELRQSKDVDDDSDHIIQNETIEGYDFSLIDWSTEENLKIIVERRNIKSADKNPLESSCTGFYCFFDCWLPIETVFRPSNLIGLSLIFQDIQISVVLYLCICLILFALVWLSYQFFLDKILPQKNKSFINYSFRHV